MAAGSKHQYQSHQKQERGGGASYMAASGGAAATRTTAASSSQNFTSATANYGASGGNFPYQSQAHESRYGN